MPITNDVPISRYVGRQDRLILTDQIATTEPIDLEGFSQAKILIPAGFATAVAEVWECHTEEGTYVRSQDYDQVDLSMNLVASKGVPFHPSLFTSQWVKLVLDVDNTATPVYLLRRG